MVATPKQAIEQTEASIANTLDALLEEAKKQIDQYWLYFNDENKRLAQLHKSGQETAAKPNQVAPVIEKRVDKSTSTTRHYIVWKRHSIKFRSNLAKAGKARASLRLHSYAADDASACIKQYCTWNAPAALELEQKLIPYRLAIKALHECSKKIRVGIRRINKTEGEDKNV
jgi:hypothetical protein